MCIGVNKVIHNNLCYTTIVLFYHFHYEMDYPNRPAQQINYLYTLQVEVKRGSRGGTVSSKGSGAVSTKGGEGEGGGGEGEGASPPKPLATTCTGRVLRTKPRYFCSGFVAESDHATHRYRVQ